MVNLPVYVLVYGSSAIGVGVGVCGGKMDRGGVKTSEEGVRQVEIRAGRFSTVGGEAQRGGGVRWAVL